MGEREERNDGEPVSVGRVAARRRSAVALAGLCVALVAVVMAWSGRAADDGLNLAGNAPTEPPSTASDDDSGESDDQRSAFHDLGSGWHELDTGPVPPSELASIDWNGSELAVLSEGRVFVYDAVTEAWRELPTPQLGPAEGTIAWLGDRLFVVARDGRYSASLDPEAPLWRGHGSVPHGFADVGVMEGPSSPNQRPSLIWTGEAVVAVTRGAVFDAGTKAWSALPLPVDPVSFVQLMSTNPVWDGEEVVLSYPHDRPGLAYDRSGDGFRVTPGIDPWAVPTPGFVGDGLAAHLGDEVLVVRRGLAATFDARTDRWTVLPPVPGIEEMNGCPSHIASLGDSVVVAPCHGADPVHLVDGAWRPVPGYDPVTPCCIGQWIGVGGALLIWDSDTDELHNEHAPYLSARIWVPPSS